MKTSSFLNCAYHTISFFDRSSNPSYRLCRLTESHEVLYGRVVDEFGISAHIVFWLTASFFVVDTCTGLDPAALLQTFLIGVQLLWFFVQIASWAFLTPHHTVRVGW